MPILEFEIVGLRIENCLLPKCEGHNCDFKKYLDDSVKYIFLLKWIPESSSYSSSYPTKTYELTLWEEQDECYSGWTISNFGHLEFKNVSRFSGKTHSPIKSGDKIKLNVINNKVEFDKNDEHKIENDYFKYSDTGGDPYYPEGYVKVMMEKFKIVNPKRLITLRPVWIYYGNSCTGKTYLSSKYNHMLSVYETDMADKLPDVIYDDIIVIGNKYKYTLDDVKSKIYHIDKCDIILVRFSREDEIKKLQLEIEHLKYKPSSDGYEETKQHFQELVKN